MNPNTKRALIYGALVVLNTILTETAIQLGAGNVPIPDGLRWIVPIVVAGVTTLTMLLPKIDVAVLITGALHRGQAPAPEEPRG